MDSMDFGRCSKLDSFFPSKQLFKHFKQDALNEMILARERKALQLGQHVM